MHARLCDAMAARSTNRLRQLDMFGALDAAAGDVTLERRAAVHLALYRPASPTQTYVVLVTHSADGALVAFVGGDLISLSLVSTEQRSGAPRGAAIEAAAAFGRHLFLDERHVPVLAHDGADACVVALPLLHLTPLELRTTFSRWVTPGDLGCGPLARSVRYAVAHVATLLQSPLVGAGADGAVRGARPLRSIARRPYHPPPCEPRWAAQLRFVESVDTAFRATLLGAPVANPLKDYLAGWAAQIATSHNLELPPALRGAPQAFDDPALLELSFPEHAPVLETAPIDYPAPQ